MNHTPTLHPALRPLAPLVGVFTGDGAGDYPTIEAFTYREEVTFGHVGAPVLAYHQRTRSPDGAPMHAESGFLRMPAADRVEWTLAHSFGIVELLEGSWDGRTLELTSTSLVGSATAKDVGGTRRRYHLEGDVLRTDVWMSYAGYTDEHHLTSVLHREV